VAGVGSFPLDPGLPLLLARLHRAMAVGSTLAVHGAVADVAADVVADVLADVLVGGGFAVAARGPNGVTLARRARTLPDFVGPGLRALVCGLNPSLVAADAGYGYAGRSNRFWPAALAVGLVTRGRDSLHALTVDRVGMTDLVKRATPSASELTPDEYRSGARRVRALVDWLRPERVIFVGLTGWRAAVDRAAGPGWQPGGFGDVPAYVMPSTSGLNAHARLHDLVDHLRAALHEPAVA
jgi:TDG/mug DNA glycosylase family protein